jgi:phosphohistidine phosphatase
MPRLMLLRHAKSAWPEGIDDHERPLAPRGQKAAPAMGAYMAREGLMPDRVIVSTAVRTRQTWSLLQPHIEGKPDAGYVRDLYEAPAERIADVIRSQTPRCACLLVIGHNPGFQDLALALLGDGEATEDLSRKFPTAGLAVIDFVDSDWPNLAAGAGRLERFVTPRSLPQRAS